MSNTRHLRETIFVLMILLLNIQSFASGKGLDALTEGEVYGIIVARDGSGDFMTVQDAFNAIPDYSEKRVVLFIKNGIYKEKIVLPPSKINVSMIGENVDSVVITYDDHSGKGTGNDTLNTFNSYSFSIQADGFVAEDITFENSAGRFAGQAVAVAIKSDKVIFKHCRIMGNQDTFFAEGPGRLYIDSCYIEGTTDFTFGSAIAVFEDCTLHSMKNSHVTAASTPQGNKYGFVFLKCRLTAADSINKVSLGRPWRPYARVAYIKCNIGSHIIAGGWNNWRNPQNEKTAFYAEYQCMGAGYKPAERVPWSKQLSDAEASEYTLEKIFAANSSAVSYSIDWIPYTK
jgi:pectinesterase